MDDVSISTGWIYIQRNVLILLKEIIDIQINLLLELQWKYLKIIYIHHHHREHPSERQELDLNENSHMAPQDTHLPAILTLELCSVKG